MVWPTVFQQSLSYWFLTETPQGSVWKSCSNTRRNAASERGIPTCKARCVWQEYPGHLVLGREGVLPWNSSLEIISVSQSCKQALLSLLLLLLSRQKLSFCQAQGWKTSAALFSAQPSVHAPSHDTQVKIFKMLLCALMPGEKPV